MDKASKIGVTIKKVVETGRIANDEGLDTAAYDRFIRELKPKDQCLLLYGAIVIILGLAAQEDLSTAACCLASRLYTAMHEAMEEATVDFAGLPKLTKTCIKRPVVFRVYSGRKGVVEFPEAHMDIAHRGPE